MQERPDLRVEKLYRNTGNWKNESDEFNNMFRQFPDGKGIQNSGGFRYKSKTNQKKSITNAAFVLLVTSFAEPEWPDHFDRINGLFTYYGDNREPGNTINETHIGGNILLAETFNRLHSGNREMVSPFLCFEAVKDNKSYMKFLGLAAPGASSLASVEDLTAVWRVQSGQRFQNYKAIFTILMEETVPWSWLDDLVEGISPAESKHCPLSWVKWVKKETYNPFTCLEKRVPRAIKDQIPRTDDEKRVLYLLFSLSDREFEFAAKKIIMLVDNRFANLEVTPQYKDRGRDLIGLFNIGHAMHMIPLEVSIEAKKWKQDSGIGVKPMARLISRLKHRDLGVFITTSYFNQEVQQELIDDKHPVLLISGGDIANIIIAKELYGRGYEKKFEEWLESIKEEARLH